MRKVKECPKGICLVSNFINFLEEKKKVIDFLVDFYIFYKNDIKTFLRIKFRTSHNIFLLYLTNPSLGSIFFFYRPY